jgi:hypothetical protein
LLNGFDALAANLAKVRALGKEPSEHPNTIFYGVFILRGVGPGKVGIGLQLLGNFLMLRKRFVVIKGQRFNEGREVDK